MRSAAHVEQRGIGLYLAQPLIGRVPQLSVVAVASARVSASGEIELFIHGVLAL